MGFLDFGRRYQGKSRLDDPSHSRRGVVGQSQSVCHFADPCGCLAETGKITNLGEFACFSSDSNCSDNNCSDVVCAIPECICSVLMCCFDDDDDD